MNLLHYGGWSLLCSGNCYSENPDLPLLWSLLTTGSSHAMFLFPLPCAHPMPPTPSAVFHSWLQFMFLFLHQVPRGSLLTLLLSLINVTSLLPTSCSPLWMVNSVLPPLGTALRVLWGRCRGPGAGRLPALVSIESQQPPLLLNILLGLQLLQCGLGRDFH